MKTGQKIRVSDPGGGKKHFGWIENVVKDMFDGSELYIVRTRIDGVTRVRTYARNSVFPLRKNSKL